MTRRAHDALLQMTTTYDNLETSSRTYCKASPVKVVRVFVLDAARCLSLQTRATRMVTVASLDKTLCQSC